MTITADTIRKTYVGLRRAKMSAYNAAEEEAVAKAELEEARTNAIVAERIKGKNEMEREAAAKTVLADQLGEWQMAAAEAREARHHLDLAALNVEEMRLLMRLEELAAFTQAGVTPPNHNGG